MTQGGGDEPVLPPKPAKPRNVSVYLPDEMWEALDEIVEASPGYSRNEVIQRFLENRIAAWRREKALAAGTAK